MTLPSSSTALCSALPVPELGDAGELPEWIHLLPAGSISTQDGRGPYSVASMAALAAALNSGGKLAVDECHSTDLAAPSGNPAPARGWMTEFEAREDGPPQQQGLWAKTKWTGQGRQLMEDGAYNGISPVILHDKKNAVVGLLRASLTNAPNLKGLTALHSQDNLAEGTDMDWKMKLIEWLGLDAGADDASIEAALKAKLASADKPAMQSQQFDVTKDPAFIAIQSELASTVTKLNAQADAGKRDKATAFIDGAINDGRVGVKPVRDKYIARHMVDPAETEAFIAALPILKGAALQSEAAPGGDADGALDDGDRRVMQLMGISEDEYTAGQAASGNKKAL